MMFQGGNIDSLGCILNLLKYNTIVGFNRRGVIDFLLHDVHC